MRLKKPSHHRRQFQDAFAKMYPEFLKHDNIREGHSGVPVKVITFVVCETCTLNCSYCYQCDKNQKAVMTKETAKAAVDMILDREKMNGYMDPDDCKGIVLDFIGGEPLLNIEVMDYIVDYFRYKATLMNHPWGKYYMISITSNGTNYFDEKVQKFMQKNKNRCSLTITIDGDKELHDSCRVFHDGRGSYDVVVKAIKHGIENYSMKSTKVTFAPENIPYISKAVPHLFELGLTDIFANCIFENKWVPERDAPLFFNQLLDLADYMIDNKVYQYAYCSIFDDTIGQPVEETNNTNWCGGNGQMLAIGTDGRLFPCIRFMKYSLQDKSLQNLKLEMLTEE